MLTDCNPSVLCGLFCTQKGYKNFIQLVDNRKGMRVREIRFVDIGIPLNEDFDDNINFLKGGSMLMLRRLAEFELPFGLKEKALKKMGLKPFDYSKPWQHDNKNPMLYAGLTPLFVDDKYINGNIEGEDVYTKEEKEKCKRLLSWDTPDYKPKIEGVFDK